MTQPSLPTSQDDAPPKQGKKRSFALLAAVLIVAALGGGAYWYHMRNWVSTDDAYIDGHISQVAAETGGRVTRLYVRDNEKVQAGQVLLEIDPRDAKIKRDQARAGLASAQAQLDQARGNLALHQAQESEALASADAARADLMQAQHDLARYQHINPNAITRQSLDNAGTTTRGAAAKLDAAQQNAAGAHAAIAVARAAVDSATAQIATAHADLDAAELTLTRTHLVAPVAGRVAKRNVEQGNFVTAGEPLVTIVQDDLWVTADFKETQLTRIRAGQPVTISVDAFPAAKLTGHIDSFTAGTGSVFSALPAENATGNYVKVVQRLAVKIVFDGQNWQDVPLSPGMSVIPSVNVENR